MPPDSRFRLDMVVGNIWQIRNRMNNRIWY